MKVFQFSSSVFIMVIVTISMGIGKVTHPNISKVSVKMVQDQELLKILLKKKVFSQNEFIVNIKMKNKFSLVSLVIRRTFQSKTVDILIFNTKI